MIQSRAVWSEDAVTISDGQSTRADVASAGGHIKDVVVIGAGKTGTTLAELLASTDD
jgi:hypothetical protein